MKILFVCHKLPYPPNRGGKIRSFNMISHLGKKHSVVVASLAHSEQELKEGAELRGYCDEVIAEVVPDSVRWFNAFKALPTATPSSVAFFWCQRLYERINERVRNTHFDMVWVHCAFVAQYVLQIENATRILDYGDLDSVKWAEYAKWKSLPLSLGYGIESRKLRNYERSLASRFHRCTVTTHGEKEEFESLGVATPCDVIPNGVDTSYFSAPKRDSTRPIIVFLGRMDYFPNIDGVCHFVEEVFPLVRARVPDVEFRIIGSNPSRKIRELSKIPGISVTGHVPDVRSYVTDAALSVAPLRIARGTQNKILESMAISVPVVASPQAAKGIQAVPGRDLLVAETPEMFATQIVRVLQDSQLRKSLSQAARNQVNAAHLWPRSMAILDGVLTEATTQSSPISVSS